MGAFEDVAGPSNPNSDPCAQNDALTETGPGALTYTTAPFSQSRSSAARSTPRSTPPRRTPDTELVATLEDVAPDGTATPLTTGALLGSLRALDSSRSWLAPGGQPLLPYHPYTPPQSRRSRPGSVTRFDIEIRPTFAQIDAGHRLRLTLTTSDLPTLVPTEADATNLIGGIYQVQRNTAAASYVELLSAPASQLTSGAKAAAHRTTHRRQAAPPAPASTGGRAAHFTGCRTRPASGLGAVPLTTARPERGPRPRKRSAVRRAVRCAQAPVESSPAISMQRPSPTITHQPGWVARAKLLPIAPASAPPEMAPITATPSVIPT